MTNSHAPTPSNPNDRLTIRELIETNLGRTNAKSSIVSVSPLGLNLDSRWSPTDGLIDDTTHASKFGDWYIWTQDLVYTEITAPDGGRLIHSVPRNGPDYPPLLIEEIQALLLGIEFNVDNEEVVRDNVDLIVDLVKRLETQLKVVIK